eukprot:14109985-Alexandrium_andersonii.AAC.1
MYLGDLCLPAPDDKARDASADMFQPSLRCPGVAPARLIQAGARPPVLSVCRPCVQGRRKGPVAQGSVPMR